MKLWKVAVTFAVVVVADDEEDARDEGYDAAVAAAESCDGAMAIDVVPVTHAEQLTAEQLVAAPWGASEMSAREILEGT